LHRSLAGCDNRESYDPYDRTGVRRVNFLDNLAEHIRDRGDELSFGDFLIELDHTV
jgi:hypothetical protein